MTVASEAQKLVQDAVINLLEITHTTAGTFRFSTSNVDPLVSVTFDGDSYLARSYELSAFNVRSQGPLPRPVLALDNTDRFWFSVLRDHKNLIGATVVYREVYRQNLDDGASPDATQLITRMEYVVRQMARSSQERVEFKLASPLDVEQSKLGRTMLRHACSHTYRVPTATTNQFTDVNTAGSNVTCPYVGSNYFAKDGTVEASWADDDCGQRLSDCKLRFGASAELPYQGYPSIGNPNA